MDAAYEAILSLRAIRSFDAAPIAPADLEAVLQAARWTGSAKNRQDWAFVVVDDPDQKERLTAAGDFTVPIASAPAAMCLVAEPGGYEFDTGRLAQNIMLAASSVGLATCPVTLHHEDVAADVLGLPDGYRCRYAIAIGYPGPDARAGRFGGRRPLDELVHRNRFGS